MGQVSTPAKDVIRLPCALKGEMRTSRWVPFSPAVESYTHAMTTAMSVCTSQVSIGKGALNLYLRGFDAEVGGHLLDNSDLETSSFGKPLVHAVEHARPVRRLCSSRTAVDAEGAT